MSLVNRWNRQLVDPVLNFQETEQFSVNAGDSLDVQQFLGSFKRSDDLEADLWKGRGLDPYGDKVAELGDEVQSGSREFLVKAGKIPLGVAEVDVEDPDGSLNRSAGIDLEWKNTDFDTIKSRVTNMVADSDVKIPEKLAKYAGQSQKQAGGEFEVDRDIDDFDDALRAFGAGSVTFQEVPEGAAPTPGDGTSENSSGDTSDSSESTTSKAGAAAVVAGGLLLGLLGLAASEVA